MKLSANRRGDISEIMFCRAMMEEGWEVFRNMSCDGPVDVVLMNALTGDVRKVDLKTATRYVAADGRLSITFTVNKERKEKLGVEYIGVDPEEVGTFYTEKDLEKYRKESKEFLAKQKRPVKIDGVHYGSQLEASKKLEVAQSTIKTRVASDNYPTWSYT